MTGKLIPMNMYTQYVQGQLLLMPANNEKQLHWLRQEERQLMREATELSQKDPENATAILLKYMQRITHVRELIESIQKAPLFA